MKWLQRLQHKNSESSMKTELTLPPEVASVSSDSNEVTVTERDYILNRLNACLLLSKTMPDFHQKSPAFHKQYHAAVERLQKRLQVLFTVQI
jgi:hypothetical protein